MMYLKPVLGTGAIAAIALLVPSPVMAQSVPSAARNACIMRTAEEMGVATRDIAVTKTGSVSAESGAVNLSLRNNKTSQTAECRVNTIDNTVLSVNLGGNNNNNSGSNNTSTGIPEFWVVKESKTFLNASPGLLSKNVTSNVPGGTVLRNLSCQKQTLPTWCQVEFRDDPSVKGWAFTPTLNPYTASTSPSTHSTTSGSTGQVVPGLADLVGAKAGQAENSVLERGYELRRSAKQADSSFTYWLERGTGSCVAIRTTDGRYGAIVYTEDRDCKRQ